MKKIAIITLSDTGVVIGEEIKKTIGTGDIYTLKKIDNKKTAYPYKTLKQLVPDLFYRYDGLIFIMAAGIVEIVIAAHIKDKKTDPAILVIDEKGKFVISLLSGHLGGANDLTKIISAGLFDSIPVITTASDVHNKPALDIFFHTLGWIVENPGFFPVAISSLIHEKEIYLYDPTTKVKGYLKNEPSVKSIFNLDQIKQGNSQKPLILVSNKIYNNSLYRDNTLLVRPKNIILGIGCKRNTPFAVIEKKVISFFKINNLSLLSIKRLATIDIKKDEKGIIQLSEKYNLPVTLFSRDDIKRCEQQYKKSKKVNQLIGVNGVCEPVVLLCGAKCLLIPKMKMEDVTLAAGEEDC